MIEELVEKINQKKDFLNGSFEVARARWKSDYTLELWIILERRNNYQTLISREVWRLLALKTYEFKNTFYWGLTRRITILNKHPLLWQYRTNELECKIIGYPKNLNEFIGELFFMYEKVCGHWISMHEEFTHNISKKYYETKELKIKIFEPMKIHIEEVCKNHGIELKVLNILFGECYNENTHILFFDDEVICQVNEGQPYIIAEVFKAEKLEETPRPQYLID